MKLRILFILSIFFSLTINAQTTAQDNSLDEQFRDVYKKSNNYQEFKVIRKTSYAKLHANVLDSVKSLKAELTKMSSEINTKDASILTLEKENKDANNKLNIALKKENSISLFGIQLSKSSYGLILFSIIIILAITLAYFIYKFKNSNVLTTEAKANLEEVESEFNLFRKKSLEREQKLRRQLQDEIIKNRNN